MIGKNEETFEVENILKELSRLSENDLINIKNVLVNIIDTAIIISNNRLPR